MVLRVIFLSGLFLLNIAFAEAQKASADGMVLIPKGSYLPLYSGNSLPDEGPAFYMDRFAVTNEDFLQFIKENPQWGKSEIKKLFSDEGYLKHWNGNTGLEGLPPKSPVVNISWFAAQKYCECQGKRLPTTAEWERVASAGWTMEDGKKEPGFKQWILQMASKRQEKPIPAVGSTRQNYFGVWDMHGLIWEWTYDFNTALTTGESRGNSSLDNTLFCGGGSLESNDTEDYAAFLRYALRSSLKAKNVLQNVGFRCAGDVNANPK